MMIVRADAKLFLQEWDIISVSLIQSYHKRIADVTLTAYQNIVNNGILNHHFDTNNLIAFVDWQNDDGSKIEISKEKFLASMRQTSPHDANYIFLLHDTHYQSSW